MLRRIDAIQHHRDARGIDVEPLGVARGARMRVRDEAHARVGHEHAVPREHPVSVQQREIRGIERSKREHDPRHADGERSESRRHIRMVEPCMHDPRPRAQELAREIDDIVANRKRQGAEPRVQRPVGADPPERGGIRVIAAVQHGDAAAGEAREVVSVHAVARPQRHDFVARKPALRRRRDIEGELTLRAARAEAPDDRDHEVGGREGRFAFPKPRGGDRIVRALRGAAGERPIAHRLQDALDLRTADDARAARHAVRDAQPERSPAAMQRKDLVERRRVAAHVRSRIAGFPPRTLRGESRENALLSADVDRSPGYDRRSVARA